MCSMAPYWISSLKALLMHDAMKIISSYIALIRIKFGTKTGVNFLYINKYFEYLLWEPGYMGKDMFVM